MADPIVSMAKDLVMELIKQNLIAPEDMTKELQKTHASLLELKAKESPGGTDKSVNSASATAGPVDWKKSIKKYTVECLVCGETFKQLSIRHLKTHDLDQRTYRQQFGIPRTQALSAKETTALRKRAVQASRPWEKAPTYLKAKGATGTKGTAAKTKGVRKKVATASSR